MPTRRERIRNEVEALYDQGAKLAAAFQKKEAKQFQYAYQDWYTKAVMGHCLQDR